MDLHHFRRQYQAGGLRRKDLNADPIQQFEQWFDEIVPLNIPDPTAMVLATVDQQQQPLQRIVLLKAVNEQGFVFFTNRYSAKGQQIAANNKVCLHFPWHFVERQVIVSGMAELLSKEDDADYFSTRPQASQWAAWASNQSQPLASRQALLDQYEAVKKRYSGAVPLPDFWGGYRVVPTAIEFWQGGEDRLHDRFVYRRHQDGWHVERLSP
jgi:pyridoxamine 5'-phosphate oxidase